MTDLICIGLTTLDVLARPVEEIPENDGTAMIDDISLAVAGTAGGTAVIAAKLGLNTALASLVGEDNNGGIVLNMLEEMGVDQSYVVKTNDMRTSTTVLAISKQGARPNFHMLGASILSSLTPDIIEAAKSARFFHFGGVGFPNLIGADTFEALGEIKQAGTVITCDLIAPTPEVKELLAHLLPFVDVFMPSMAEARILLGDISAEEAAQSFVELGAQACIVKVGAQGAVGYIDGKIVKIPSRAITPVDTTSCGDAFCAGVISGLARGMGLEQAAKFATVTASFVAEGAGTLGMLEGEAQVLEALESNNVS